MKPARLDFYFDFISMYACFAWRQITEICTARDVELVAHPVIFGKLLDHWGQLGPAEIPPKREFVYKWAARYAKLQGFEFDPPAQHPYNPLPSLRLALPEVGGPDQHRIINAIFDAGWSNGQDIGNPAVLSAVLDADGLDGTEFTARTTEPAVKDALRRETEDALARGVFGVPTMIVDEELFWGNDQMDHVILCLDGKDPLDKARVAALLARERGVDRKDRT